MKKMTREEYQAQKQTELKIRQEKIRYLTERLANLERAIKEEQAIPYEQRLARAKQAYSLEEYIFYTETRPIKKGSPAYLKRKAEYERDMKNQANLIITNATLKRRHVLKELKQLSR